MTTTITLKLGPTGNASDSFIVDAPAVYRYALGLDKILEHYNNIPKPRYKHPPIVFIILDDLIGDNKVFKRQSLINNITIKHRHLGVNLVFTSQNPKSIPNIIRNNIDVYVLYKFANVKMVIEKIFEEVSGLLTESQFEEIYKHATSEPYNALVIDNHPKTDRDKRFKKNFDVVLTHGS